MKRISAILLLIVVSLCLVNTNAMGESTTSNDVMIDQQIKIVPRATKVSSITFDKLEKALRVGEQQRIQVNIKYTGTKPKRSDMTMYSKNPSIAEIIDKGSNGFWIKAYKTGKVTIVAECLGKSNSITLNVAGKKSPVKQIATGDFHSLALLTNGDLYAWGWNSDGQLGDGTYNNKNTPVFIGTGFTQIDAGWGHSLALKGDSLYTWGLNNTSVLQGTGFTQITAGGFNFLALKGSSLYTLETGDGIYKNKDTLVFIGTGFTQISAGNSHSLALKGSSLYAWGDNKYGQLGDGTNINKNTPVFIGTGFTKIAAGDGHSLALKGNSLYAWGSNWLGQLGNGTYRDKNTPVFIGTGFTQITAGNLHSLALKGSSLYAWGWNMYGQLGDGSINNRNTPVFIGNGFTQIAAGDRHSLALKGSSLYAWGNNYDGQLGDGTNKDRNVPTRITFFD